MVAPSAFEASSVEVAAVFVVVLAASSTGAAAVGVGSVLDSDIIAGCERGCFFSFVLCVDFLGVKCCSKL